MGQQASERAHKQAGWQARTHLVDSPLDEGVREQPLAVDGLFGEQEQRVDEKLLIGGNTPLDFLVERVPHVLVAVR